jgi:hypothetical protein
MEGALSLLPDWKGNALADLSWQTWLENFHFRWVPHTL